MKKNETEVYDNSIDNNFLPSTPNTEMFNNKPVYTNKNTAMFYFKDFHDKEIWFLIEKDETYKYQWILNENSISRKRPDPKGIQLSKKTRDENLINDLTSQIQIPKDEIKAFFTDLGLFMDENEYKILINDIPEDFHDEPLQYESIYNSFEDYPKHIQQEALQIVEKNPLKFFESVLYYIHKGDTKAKNLVLLSIGSFVCYKC